MAKDALDPKRAEFIALAQTAFDRMFGDDGQNGLVTFSQREEWACAVTDELARWLMAEHVLQDPPGPISVATTHSNGLAVQGGLASRVPSKDALAVERTDRLEGSGGSWPER